MRVHWVVCFLLAGCVAENSNFAPPDGAVDFAQLDGDSVPDLAQFPACATTLSGIGRGDFSISFTVTTTATAQSTLLYQRAACAGGNFWDAELVTGTVDVQLDGDAFCETATIAAINDGSRHRVVISRASSVLSISIDGAASAVKVCGTQIGSLSPLGIGSGNPCEGPNALQPLVGKIEDVCLLRGGT